jgi:general secretion pathway protein G
MLYAQSFIGFMQGRKMISLHANRRAARGFTLLEIMVVVVIIGLLAAIVAPSVIQNIDKAAITRAKQDIRTIEVALNQFRLNNFRYPTEEEGLQVLLGRGTGINDEEYEEYLPRMPIDPWDQAYMYENPGKDGRTFDVYTYGADKTEGGEDVNADIGNWDLN